MDKGMQTDMIILDFSKAFDPACLTNTFSGNAIITGLEDAFVNGYRRSLQAKHRVLSLKELLQKVYQSSEGCPRALFWDSSFF